MLIGGYRSLCPKDATALAGLATAIIQTTRSRKGKRFQRPMEKVTTRKTRAKCGGHSTSLRFGRDDAVLLRVRLLIWRGRRLAIGTSLRRRTRVAIFLRGGAFRRVWGGPWG